MVLNAEEKVADSWTYGGVTYRLPIPRDQVIIPPDLPKLYIVKERDTLWDISGAYLHNPFFWPLIWEVNTQIKNPHLIFPGDEIKFPGPFAAEVREREEEIAKEEKPLEERGETAEVPERKVIKKKPEGTPEYHFTYNLSPLFFATGVISSTKSGEDIRADGEIIAAPFANGTITFNSRIFVDIPGCPEGAYYKIFRIGDKVKHPKTKKILGRMVHTLGYLQIVCSGPNNSEGIVTRAYDEIQIGDKVVLFEESPFRFKREPAWKKCYDFGSSLKGTIVASINNLAIFSDLDIIFLDLGRDEGIKPGDYLSVVLRSGTKKCKIYKQIGQLVIIGSQQHTSSAVVTKSIYELKVGDTVELL